MDIFRIDNDVFVVVVVVVQTCEKKLQKSIQLAFNGRFYVSTEGSPIFQASLSNLSTAIQFRSKNISGNM